MTLGTPGQPPPLNYAPQARDDLRTIAKHQKGVILCILAYFVLVIGQFALPPELRFVLAFAALAVSVTAVVFVFMLSLALYGTGTGIVLGILTLIPLVGLAVLLIVNAKATRILNQHGIKVGLLGARMSDIPVPRL